MKFVSTPIFCPLHGSPGAKTVDGEINPALLLLSPTEHDRFEFYDGSLRKES